LPEFLQPKELFSTTNNNQPQEEATKILQSLDIENNKIRCTECCALQALIVCVKQLVQLFPEVKENLKSPLTSGEV